MDLFKLLNPAALGEMTKQVETFFLSTENRLKAIEEKQDRILSLFNSFLSSPFTETAEEMKVRLNSEYGKFYRLQQNQLSPDFFDSCKVKEPNMYSEQLTHFSDEQLANSKEVK